MAAGMTVAQLRARPYEAKLKRAFITAQRRVDTVRGVLVDLELADGTLGRGSAAETMAVTGESTQSLLAAVHGPIASAVVGPSRALRQHAQAIGGSCAGNSSAKAAVDVALHDAWARSMGLPLAAALGGDPDVELSGDMTISLEDPDAMAENAVAAVEQGYQVLKIKLGHDWRADLKRLTTVQQAAPAAVFRLDATQGWDVKSAIRIIRRLEDAEVPVQLVEQPVAKHDLLGLATVTRAVDVPIMADESVASPADAIELVSRRAVDLLNIKLAKCGGIGQALAIADIGAAGGVQCMIGAMMEPRISITAAAHVAAAHSNITLLDLDSAEWIDDPSLAGGYTMDRSALRLNPGPGIGFD